MVLLTGPAGAGKSALVQVLAKELNCELKEWTNPITDSYGESSFLDKRSNWSGRGFFYYYYAHSLDM